MGRTNMAGGLALVALVLISFSAEAQEAGGSWMTDDDYLAKALREGRSGLVEVTITASPKGKVTDCAVTQSSGSSDLDAATCPFFVRKMRFKPAIDATGEKVEQKVVKRMNWTLPRR
mgnify:CR=1 FL=1